MKIDYCPKCNKAGLRLEDKDGKTEDGLTSGERFKKWNAGETLVVIGFRKWCPRCKEWVKPEDHPYYGKTIGTL